MRKLILLTLTGVLAFASAGCEQKGPAQKAGEKIDNTIDSLKHGGHESIGDKVDDAIDRARDDAKDAMEKARDEAKEAADRVRDSR